MISLYPPPNLSEPSTQPEPPMQNTQPVPPVQKTQTVPVQKTQPVPPVQKTQTVPVQKTQHEPPVQPAPPVQNTVPLAQPAPPVQKTQPVLRTQPATSTPSTPTQVSSPTLPFTSPVPSAHEFSDLRSLPFTPARRRLLSPAHSIISGSFANSFDVSRQLGSLSLSLEKISQQQQQCLRYHQLTLDQLDALISVLSGPCVSNETVNPEPFASDIDSPEATLNLRSSWRKMRKFLF